jgi:glycosyltransferase involved in cell wall biosynthesis
MISVCIASYNGEKYIKQQLDSILSQLKKGDEVVISDDSSNDNTIEIIKSYKDKRIKLLENCSFKSPIFNLENALKEAKGDYIFLADQDDIWLSYKISHTIEKLKIFDLVVCNGSIVDQDKNVIHPSYFEWKGSRPGFLKNLAKNSYLGCSMAFNRKILNKVLPFPKHIIMHDLWIGLIGEVVGRVHFIEEPLFCYRRHEGNYTADISKGDNELSDFGFWFKIWYRMVMVFYVGKRVVFNK